MAWDGQTDKILYNLKECIFRAFKTLQIVVKWFSVKYGRKPSQGTHDSWKKNTEIFDTRFFLAGKSQTVKCSFQLRVGSFTLTGFRTLAMRSLLSYFWSS